MSKDKKLRSVNTHFWDDGYIVNLDPIEKLLFLYFITNPLTNLAGIYEMPIRRIAFDTGIDKDMIIKILERFERDNKILYRSNYIILTNYYKNQKYNPSMKTNVGTIIAELPDEIREVVKNLKIKGIYSLITDCTQPDPTVRQVEDKDKVEDEDIKKMFIHAFNRGPKIWEKEDIDPFVIKYGMAKVEVALVAGARDGCKKLKTLLERIDGSGIYKPFPKDFKGDSEKQYNTDPFAGLKR